MREIEGVIESDGKRREGETRQGGEARQGGSEARGKNMKIGYCSIHITLH